ncbi:MAG: hypothetical protein EOM59_00435 [Clostridia bacterium]|nr:hypothetical protein [Clostridia bacterium]
MSSQYLSFFITGTAYTLYLAGVLLVLRKQVKIVRLKILLRHRLKLTKQRTKDLSPLHRYIRSMLFVCFRKPPDEKAFLWTLGLVSSFTFLLGLRHFSVFTALGVAFMLSFIPVLFLMVRVESIRKRGNKEGMSVIADLYRNYWMQNKNIFSAMEETVKGNAECPVCKNLIYKLLLRLRNTGNPIETRECIDQFTFSMGTVWGRMLGVCIRLSAESGVDISEGLTDISEQLKIAYTRAEERRRLNSETARMTIFLVPMLYAGTVFMSLYYLDIDLLGFIHNQWGTPEGIIFFVTIAFLFMLNLTILEFVQNQKIDY